MAAINYFDFEKRCNLYDVTKRTDITNEFIWGVSTIKIDTTYHAYIERWIDDDGINGYSYYGKIFHSSHANPLGPFDTMTECTGLMGIAANAGAIFNPDPIVYNGFIYLFYSGTTDETPAYPLVGTPARNNNRIFLAKAPLSTPTSFTLVGSSPILNPGSGQLLVNNSRFYWDVDGVPKMIYKYATIAAPSVLLLSIATAANIEGPWTNGTSPLDAVEDIEDPCVWREGDLFFMICKSQNTLDGLLLYSKTGYANDWHAVTEKARAYRLTAAYDSLTSSLQPRMERPFVLVEDGAATAFYLAILTAAETSSVNQGRTIR
jgi:hypothetical protein